MLTTWLVTLSALLLKYTGVKGSGYCTLPSYLWEAEKDGSDRKWVSSIRFPEDNDVWKTRLEITVKKTEITIREAIRTACQRGSEVNTCHRNRVVKKIICISEEPNNKFRVQIQGDSNPMFGCLKFERRNTNVVQIYQAIPNPINKDTLCYDKSLKREIWPWIAEPLTDWNFCLLNGGYDFRAYAGQDRQEVCGKAWRPSRIEGECMLGEGIIFYFPEDQCSPFRDKTLVRHMRCWASWREEDFSFIMLADPGGLPRYTLRLPLNANIYDEMLGHLYLEGVIPDNNYDLPDDVKFWELNMLRSEPGVCYDESEQCRRQASEGKCSSDALHQYANYCKKACNLCEFAPSPHAECHFPPDYQGDWVVFNAANMDTILIEQKHMHIPSLGRFICKSKHWDEDYFKVLTVYQNGCRPRYSCLHLTQYEGTLLKYRVSASDLLDHSFELCKFTDDPLPLGGKLRSDHMKILYPLTSMYYAKCGLNGMSDVNLTYSWGATCGGTMYDVNTATCSPTLTLGVTLNSCPHPLKQEFTCLAYTKLTSGSSLLVTEPQTKYVVLDKHMCWLISRSVSKSTWQGGLTYQRVACDSGLVYYPSPYKDSLVQMQTKLDSPEDPCGKIRDQPPRENKGDNGERPGRPGGSQPWKGRPGGGGDSPTASSVTSPHVTRRTDGVVVTPGLQWPYEVKTLTTTTRTKNQEYVGDQTRGRACHPALSLLLHLLALLVCWLVTS